MATFLLVVLVLVVVDDVLTGSGLGLGRGNRLRGSKMDAARLATIVYTVATGTMTQKAASL
jgi:hypothetical protein